VLRASALEFTGIFCSVEFISTQSTFVQNIRFCVVLIRQAFIMRVIIRPDADSMSQWAALYIKNRILKFKPTADRPFVLGLPTGSSPIGT